jgi:NAD(P)-dependent dehydrogenase (short-subunit alcohol dehydrogenase family)
LKIGVKKMLHLPGLYDLTGRVAVVTGGAGLLGAQFSRTLAEAGAQVVIADIDEEAAKKQAASIGADLHSREEDQSPAQDKIDALHLDVTSPGSVNALVAAVLSRFSRLDILVNNAALDPKFDPEHLPFSGSPPSAFEMFPLEAWKQALDVNLTGLFLCCQAVVQPMLSQGGGVIINLCSIYGLVGPDQRIYQNTGPAPQYKPVYYSVTKAGVLGLTRYLATYYAGKNIRVNALTPGGVYDGHADEFVQAYSSRAVLGRMARPDELNGALLFLASDASSYMTGANLVVDGGWTAW